MPNNVNKPALNLELIIETAIAMADIDGVASTSMRKLGNQLGVEAMSLYHYVPNKAHLLQHMTNKVVSAMERPPSAMPWKEAMRLMAISSFEQLVQHPWVLGELMKIGPTYSPARFQWMDAMLGSLRTNGFSVELTHHAYHVLDGHIIGFAYWATSLSIDPDARDDLLEDVQPIMAAANVPWLLEHVQYHVDHDGIEDVSEFEFALSLILDGIERLLAIELNQE